MKRKLRERAPQMLNSTTTLRLRFLKWSTASTQYFADLANRRDVGEIGNITPQYRSCHCDALVVAVPGFKIEISDADIGRRLITTTGNTPFHIRLYKTKRFQMLFHKLHVGRLIIEKIESGAFLIGIHNTDFVHDNSSLQPGFWG
jgi:hypothetical protein